MRVLLVGVSAADLDRLRLAVAADAHMRIVGATLLDERSESDGPPKGVPYIQEALHAANADAVMMSAQAVARVHGPRARRPIEPPPAEALTARERDVLAYVAEGHGNREIGQLLGISEHTVKFHLASIYGKLGVGNRTEAVQHALRTGLLEI